MYNDTFDFYKVEKYRKHLDFNLLYNKIKQELHEQFQTSCNDWDKYDWANMIQECTKPNTIPTLTYIKDNITSTSIAPDKGKPACRCIGCELFDGYDMCYHHENFGSITQQSLDKCKKHNLLREKIL